MVLALFDAHPATACQAYQRFVAEGRQQPSPWQEVTGQIFLGGPEFLARIERLLRGKPLNNVSRAQRSPTRLSAAAVLQCVAAAYRLPQARVLDRSHREAYQTAVYLLRRAANEPLQTVAVRFGISPSRVSKIQTALDTTPRTPTQARVLATCAVTH